MRRTICLSVLLPFAMGLFGTLVAQTVALPAIADAQETRFEAERIVLVGPNGVDRARLSARTRFNASVSVLSTEGRVRALMGTGGPVNRGGLEPETADFVLFSQDGRRIARLGTRETPESHAAGVNLVLADAQGRVRLEARVAEDGTPALLLLDPNGNVTWSTP